MPPDPWLLVLDESVRGSVITVGGLMVRQADVPEVIRMWQGVKATLGIDGASELKYSMPRTHEVGLQLEASGWSQAVRIPVMLRALSEAPDSVRLLADTIIDLTGQDQPGSYYLDALGWCIRRLANHVQFSLGGPPGPHLVICDMPPRPQWVPDRIAGAYPNNSTAAFDLYARRYSEREQFAEGSGRPLKSLGFASGLLATHARHSDLVQIADLVAGTVRDFCWYNLSGDGEHLPERNYQDENFEVIAPRFHRGPQGICRFGFDVFPRRHPSADGLRAWADRCAGY